MDYRSNVRRIESSMRERRQEREEDLITEDTFGEFCLPINHKITENVNLFNVEQASEDRQLSSSNIGFKLLQKMGWKGKGLGKDEQGITEPIKSGIRDAKLGIGKQEEDDYFTAEENIQRRKLDIELEETEEVTKKREKAAYSVYACLLRAMVYRKRTSTLEALENFVQFYYLVIAEREQKIQIEVKEIHKVFFCDLCNKQYKLAMEFEAHLSSYDHNHRKRFKEMREMHGSNRDDRQKRELQRQEKEMARFAQITDARKQQQRQEQEPSESAVSTAPNGADIPMDADQRKALKFGFSAKSGPSKSKKPVGAAAKKPKVPVASIFGDDSDEEHT